MPIAVRRRWLALIIVGIICVHASNIDVSCPTATCNWNTVLQPIINSRSNNDVVRVLNGTWTGCTQSGLTLNIGVGVTLRAVEGVIVDCQNSGFPIYQDSEGTQADSIIGFTFRNGYCPDSGGMIQTAHSIMNLINCTIENSLSAVDAGAIIVFKTLFTMSGTTIRNATARAGGGALRVENDPNSSLEGTVIKNSVIRDCSAFSYVGGAIAGYSGNIYINDTLIENNWALALGGALWITGDTRLYAYRTTFSKNYAGTIAGAVGCCGPICHIYSSFFLYNYQQNLNVNDPELGGGGLWATAGNLQVWDTTFTGNVAQGDGGGMWSNYNGVLVDIRRCTFNGNFAVNRGGGLMSNSSGITIQDSFFYDNVAWQTGGGLSLYNSTYTLDSNDIKCNNATNGFAMFLVTGRGSGAMTNTIHNHIDAFASGGNTVQTVSESGPFDYHTCTGPCDQNSCSLAGACGAPAAQPFNTVCKLSPNMCLSIPNDGTFDNFCQIQPIGTTCLQHCNNGKYPHGAQLRTCQSDGTWTPLTCEDTPAPPPPPPCPPPPPSGSTTGMGSPPPASPPPPGLSCGPFPVPSNGALAGDCSLADQVICSASCAAGYAPGAGQSLSITCLNGTWQQMTATCGLCAAACDGCSVSGADNACTKCKNSFASGASCTTGVAVGIAVTAIILVLAAIIVIFVVRRRRNGGGSTTSKGRAHTGDTTLLVSTDIMSKRMRGLLKGATLLGRGGGGEVYRAILESGEMIAIKKLMAKEDRMIKEFHREVNILSRLGGERHPNVIQLKFFTSDPPCIALELAEKGSLRTAPKPADGWLAAVKQVVDGMIFLHHHMIVHLDLKPENILIGENDVVKITDFGSAQEINLTGQAIENVSIPPGDPNNTLNSMGSFSNNEVGSMGSIGSMGSTTTKRLVTDGFTGTPQYTAPERFLSPARCDLRYSDVFSFGMMAWSLVTSERPLAGENPESLVVKYTSDPEYPSSVLVIPATCVPEVKGAIEHCINREPKKRPNFKQLLNFFDNQGALGHVDRAQDVTQLLIAPASNPTTAFNSTAATTIGSPSRGNTPAGWGAGAPPTAGDGISSQRGGSRTTAIITPGATSNVNTNTGSRTAALQNPALAGIRRSEEVSSDPPPPPPISEHPDNNTAQRSLTSRV